MLEWTKIFHKVDIFMNMWTKWIQDLALIASGVDLKLTYNSKAQKVHKIHHKLDLTLKTIKVRAFYLKMHPNEKKILDLCNTHKNHNKFKLF